MFPTQAHFIPALTRSPVDVGVPVWVGTKIECLERVSTLACAIPEVHARGEAERAKQLPNVVRNKAGDAAEQDVRVSPCSRGKLANPNEINTSLLKRLDFRECEGKVLPQSLVSPSPRIRNWKEIYNVAPVKFGERAAKRRADARIASVSHSSGNISIGLVSTLGVVSHRIHSVYTRAPERRTLGLSLGRNACVLLGSPAA